MAENNNAKEWLLSELEQAPIFQGWSRDDIEKAIPPHGHRCHVDRQ